MANVAKNNLTDLQKCIDHKFQLLQNSPKYLSHISNQEITKATTEVVYKRGGKIRSMHTLQKHLSAGTENTFTKEIKGIVHLYSGLGELSYNNFEKQNLMNLLIDRLRQLQHFPDKQVEFYCSFYEMFISHLHNDELSHPDITPRDPNGDTGDTPRKEKIFKLWIDIINKVNRGKALEDINDKARFTIFVDKWIKNIIDASQKRVELGRHIANNIQLLQIRETLEDNTSRYQIPEISFERYKGYYTDIKVLATDKQIANSDPDLHTSTPVSETFEIQYQDEATNVAKNIEDKEGWFGQRKSAQLELQRVLRSQSIELGKKAQIQILSEYDFQHSWATNLKNILNVHSDSHPNLNKLLHFTELELAITLRITHSYQDSLAKSCALYSATSFMQTNEHAFEIISQLPLELQKVCVVNMEGQELRYQDFKDLLSTSST